MTFSVPTSAKIRIRVREEFNKDRLYSCFEGRPSHLESDRIFWKESLGIIDFIEKNKLVFESEERMNQFIMKYL